MCECGCGAFGGGFRFPGPDGIVYLLELYPGCGDCDTPAGVIIHRYQDTEEQREWFGDQPEMPFIDFQGNPPNALTGSSEFAQPIVNAGAVVKALAKSHGDMLVRDGKEEYLLGELIEADPDTWRDVIDAHVREQLDSRMPK